MTEDDCSSNFKKVASKENNWIGIITPTKDGKYAVARATITDRKKNIETLNDCAIKVSDAEGKKSDLKYPFVLLDDIETLRRKLIADLDDLSDFEGDPYIERPKEEIIKIINKRFAFEETKDKGAPC